LAARICLSELDKTDLTESDIFGIRNAALSDPIYRRVLTHTELKKKIVDSVIKFAKKNLVMKGQVFPPGKDPPFGTWKITRKGCERAAMYRNSWSPKVFSA